MRTIFWEVTTQCNLRCKHCYLYNEIASSSTNTTELNTENCLKIVEQFDEANVFYVSVLGGEPLYRPDIMDILNRLGEKKFWTQITTNGTLIDEKTACDLADSHIRGVFVSLEGSCAKINDAVRGKGSFDKAICGINYLKEFDIPFYIQMTVNKINYNKIEEMIEFCLEIGANRVIFNSFDDLTSNKKFVTLLNLDSKEFFAAALKIAEIKTKYPDEFISNDMGIALQFQSIHPPSSIRDKRFIRCDLGLGQLAVLHNGDVIPCKYMRDIVCGNLMETHLSNIPDSSEFKTLKKMRTFTIDDEKIQCRTCEWRYVCGGGCRGRAYSKYGTLFARDPRMCMLARNEFHE